MVAKGNVDHHRRSMSGLKVEETQKWGSAKAYERYGAPKQPDMRPKDASSPQSRDDQRGPGWQNDVPENLWLRGGGKGGEGKPGYVRGRK